MSNGPFAKTSPPSDCVMSLFDSVIISCKSHTPLRVEGYTYFIL